MASIPGHIIPCAGARHPRLRAIGGADGGDDHPRHPARADADDPAPALHLRGGGDDDAGARSPSCCSACSACGRCCTSCGFARTVLMPIVFLLCTVGAFATASRLFDVYAMLAIGIGAFFLRRRGYEMAPLVLGLVLGPPARQEPAPRAGAVRRQPGAVLHAADLHGVCRRDDLHDPAVRAGVQDGGRPRTSCCGRWHQGVVRAPWITERRSR